MIDKDEEHIGRILRHLLTGRLRKRETLGRCPDEEVLADYLDGTLPEQKRSGIETHLADCSLCLDLLAAAYRSTQDVERAGAPQHAIDRAMGLVAGKAGENFLDLVVRFVRDSLELVRTSGEWMTPLVTAPAGVRGRSAPAETGIIRAGKQMGRFSVAVEVEKVDQRLCQVSVEVKEEDRPADDIRVSLASGGRERCWLSH